MFPSKEQMRIDAEIARFPVRFRLAGFGDKEFAISRGQVTKRGLVLFLALREPVKDLRFTVHQNGVSTKMSGRWTQHGRMFPDDLRVLIKYADIAD